MTLTYGFYNSVAGDRVYDSLQLSRFMEGIVTDGILPGVGSAFNVTNGGGLIANVGTGKAWFNNTWTLLDAVYPLTLATADPILPRIDTIILEIDTSTGVRANSLKVLTGTPGSVPVAPSPVSTSLVWQRALAQCRVNAGATTIVSITTQIGVTTPLASLAVSLNPSKASGADVVAGTDDVKFVTSKAIKDGLDIQPKAAGADINTGTDDKKFVTSKAIKDSTRIPLVIPTNGKKIVPNGTNWVAQDDNGWVPDNNTWSYSSLDSPTAILSINADMTQFLSPGMRMKFTQNQAMSGYFSFDTNSTPGVGSWTIVDTAMTYTAGKYSNAATFNGTTSNINVTDQLTWKPATVPFAFGFWIKAAAPGTTSTFWQSWSANTAYAGILFQISTTGKLIVLSGANTGTVLNVDFSLFTSKATVADNTNFHHVVITFKNNYLQIYIDGVLDTYGYCLTPVFAATNYVRFGCGNNTGSNAAFFAGQLDDFFVFYNNTISQETIYAKYIQGSALGIANWNIIKTAIVQVVGAFVSSATLVTINLGNDSEIANAALSSPAYSNCKNPVGFSTNPDKWKVHITVPAGSPAKASPVISTWYGGALLSPTGPSIVAPIGLWFIEASIPIRGTTVATIQTLSMKVTLSTANNTESNPEFSSYVQWTNPTAAIWLNDWQYKLNTRSFQVLVKTTLYLNLSYGGSAGGFSNISIDTPQNTPYISLFNAYL